MRSCGTPISASAPAKPKPWMRPKPKVRRERAPMRPARQVLDAHVGDRQRDQHFDPAGRSAHHAEHARGEGDRVREREGGHREQHVARAPADQQQAGQEQQVIDARQDVFEAEAK